MNFSGWSFLFVILSIYFAFSEQLDCTQIPLNTQVAGKSLYIPDNQNSPVTLPVDFNCTYAVNPPTQVYAEITVSNNLKGVDDVIVVTDGQKTVTKITRNDPDVVFYVFPGTSTLVNVQNFDATSKFQMTISYVELPNPEQRALQKGQNLNYLMLNSIQRKPITLSADGPIILTLARSDYIVDEFDNYFVVDGFLDQPKTVKRLVDYTLTNFNTSSNVITLVGLDEKVSHSSVILNPSANLNGYYHFAGVTVDKIIGNINVAAEHGQKVGVTIVAKDAGQLVLNKMRLGDGAECKCTAVTGPPTADSKALINFKEDQYALPQLFPYPYFSFIVENCHIQFNFTTTVSPSYYQLDGERSGFIFSPIYFNSEATNRFINLTFAYTGADRKQFVVDVDRAMLSGCTSSEMDINIYDSDWKKTLSTVITGNQEGTRSRAYGSYLNVQMTGYVDGKLKWRLDSSGVSMFNVQSMLILAAFYLVISF
ncbi:hypothetical protein L3Y34_003936 [Caenorhabditis briggsae]|nr:hypothetical protein L3Y34_003936 [Caenorhabditis briggsae]